MITRNGTHTRTQHDGGLSSMSEGQLRNLTVIICDCRYYLSYGHTNLRYAALSFLYSITDGMKKIPFKL